MELGCFVIAGCSGTFRGRESFFREARFIAGQCKESSHAKSNQPDQRRHLSPLPIEGRPDDCGRYHLDECGGAGPIRASEAHPRGRQVSGPSEQWAAMLRLRPVRGTGFLQGRGGSGRRERLVPTLRGEARLGIRLSLASRSARYQELMGLG
jgi:hypothetical protein